MRRRKSIEPPRPSILLGNPSATDSPERFHDYFYSRLARQGPGSDRTTQIAAGIVGGLPLQANIVDVQCGTGATTRTLVDAFRRHVVAVDRRTDMIRRLQQSLGKDDHYGRNITALVASPEQLPFRPGFIDLLWCENFVGPFGLERALRLWQPLLKPGAFVVFSLCSWVRRHHPTDDYLARRFHYMRHVTDNLLLLEELGFEPMAHVLQEDDCWTDNLYIPMSLEIQQFSPSDREHPVVQEFTAGRKREIESYIRYKHYFRNVTYVARYVGADAPEEAPAEATAAPEHLGDAGAEVGAAPEHLGAPAADAEGQPAEN